MLGALLAASRVSFGFQRRMPGDLLSFVDFRPMTLITDVAVRFIAVCSDGPRPSCFRYAASSFRSMSETLDLRMTISLFISKTDMVPDVVLTLMVVRFAFVHFERATLTSWPPLRKHSVPSSAPQNVLSSPQTRSI